MRIIKKIVSVAMAALVMMNCMACDIQSADYTAKHLKVQNTKNIKVWYSDSSYTDYLLYVAKQFHNANSLVSIEPVQVEAVDYLEQIYKESIYNDNAADVYILPSSLLEEASDMGLALENTTYKKYYTEKKYSKAAIDASTAGGKLYGYPLSFNIPFMVYNKKAAKEVNNTLQLVEFCTGYTVNDDNKSIKQLVAWDISNSLLNYGFSSEAVTLKSSSDDKRNISIDKEKFKNILTRLYDLKYTFGFEREDVTLAGSTKDFSEGRLAYTITDAEHLKEIVDSEVEYGVCAVPSLGDGLVTANISETDLVVVNPYASDLDVSKAVAHAISYDYSEGLFARTYKMSARSVKYDKSYKNTLGEVAQLYKQSQTKAQYLGSDEFYAQYEILIGKVWDGQDIDSSIQYFMDAIDAVDSNEPQKDE